MSNADLAKACGVVPAAEDVLAEIFSKYEFALGGSDLSSAAVFSPVGFLPVIGWIASSRMGKLYGIQLEMPVVENDKSIVGFECHPKFESAHQAMLFLLLASNVSMEMFGMTPREVVLDKLYDWAFDLDAQKAGIPKLTEDRE